MVAAGGVVRVEEVEEVVEVVSSSVVEVEDGVVMEEDVVDVEV